LRSPFRRHDPANELDQFIAGESSHGVDCGTHSGEPLGWASILSPGRVTIPPAAPSPKARPAGAASSEMKPPLAGSASPVLEL